MILLEVDPNLVRPGWAPLLVVVLLGIALFFLGRSMIRQFGKIDVPADHDPDAGAASTDGPSERRSSVVGRRGNPPIPDLRDRGSQGGGDTDPTRESP